MFNIKKLLVLVLLFFMFLPVYAQRTDDFFQANECFNNRDFNELNDITLIVITQNFGQEAPLSGGIITLGIGGLCYALLKNKKVK